MTKLGFIGLGVMGAPMAAHLAAAGHDVRGYDVSAAAFEKLQAAGGHAAADVADAVAEADVVITMLPNHPQVEQVVLVPGGVLDVARPGTLLIDMSTIRPETSIEIANAARDKKIRVLDAPVSGGQAGAEQAALSIMVGGSVEDFEAAKPVFEVVGKTIVHVGPHGAGQEVHTLGCGRDHGKTPESRVNFGPAFVLSDKGVIADAERPPCEVGGLARRPVSHGCYAGSNSLTASRAAPMAALPSRSVMISTRTGRLVRSASLRAHSRAVRISPGSLTRVPEQP